MLNSIGMTIVFPLLPFLVGEYLPDSQVVVGMSALMSVFAACTFFAAPVFGTLSDHFGRKKILIISLIGSAVGYVLFGLGGSLWVLFLGRIIDGLTAGNISTLFAYISDVTEPEERAKWFGYIGAASGIGFMVGPAFGGWLGTISISLPFFATAGLIALAVLVTLIFLPESVSEQPGSPKFSLNSINITGHFRDIFTLKEAKNLLILGAFFAIGMGIYQNNVNVYLKDVFRWGPGMIGSILAFVGVCDIVSRAILLPIMLKKVNERFIGIVGLLGVSSGLGVIFLSAYFPHNSFIFLAVILIALGEGLFEPSFNSNLSKSIDENQQGKLQGVNQSLQSVYGVIVPLGAASIYVYSPAVLYIIAAVIAMGTLIIFTKLKPQPVTI
ncbi:MAG TPA: MFS transporter [Ignavibacteriaceae bacterium]|nr:MFS transporter [Ignavibacteriaceae bacterium]